MSGLSFQDLEIAHGDKVVLNKVSAILQAGQVTVVLGPNGAGKSTLLACLAGLRRPDSGRVRLDDTPMETLAPRARARRLGFIPQTPEIAWPVEARILIGLGRSPFIGARGLSLADSQAIEHAMMSAGVTALAHRDVTTLSGGERARVLIARALAGEPEWLLADEPLTGLDPGHQLDAANLFRSIAHEQATGVVITLHDLSMAARMADRILVLAGGAIIADGPPALALSETILERAYEIRARIRSDGGIPVVEILGRSSP